MKSPLSFSIKSHVDVAEWDLALQGTDAACFHSARWQSFASTDLAGRTPLFLEWRDASGSPIARATGAEVAPSQAIFRTFRRTLLVDAAPVALPPSAPPTSELLSVLLSAAQKRSFVEFHFAGYGSEVDLAVLADLGFTTAPRFEFLIDVEDGEGACWDGMESKRRNKIRRARKDGVTVQDLGAALAAEAFTRLQKETTARIRERGGSIPDPPAPEITRRRLSRLVESNLGILRGAVVGGSIEAVASFGCFNRRGYYLESAASEVGLRAQAPSLLLWETIAELARDSFKTVNLGGCSGLAESPDSPEYGLYVFKRDFGARKVLSPAGTLTLLPLRHHAGQVLRRGLGVFRNLREMTR